MTNLRQAGSPFTLVSNGSGIIDHIVRFAPQQDIDVDLQKFWSKFRVKKLTLLIVPSRGATGSIAILGFNTDQAVTSLAYSGTLVAQTLLNKGGRIITLDNSKITQMNVKFTNELFDLDANVSGSEGNLEKVELDFSGIEPFDNTAPQLVVYPMWDLILLK